MDALLNFLHTAWLILVVIFSFNIIIFVHELGHFLAARWRGLKVERFQIWFGKPIWKKTINGVQYGLGSIPAGGFVALPQMAPMEAIEGGNEENREELPPIKPIDKIIVAFAGPLFSFLLAVLAALVVWNVGKPTYVVETPVVGFVAEDSPAEKAGFRLGDEILAINGQPVNGFAGSLDAVVETVIFSKGDTIDFEVKRGAETLTLNSEFEVQKGTLLKRSGMRRVGIGAEGEVKIAKVTKGGPAEASGLKAGDVIVSFDGEKIWSQAQLRTLIKAQNEEAFTLGILRDDQPMDVITMAMVPSNKYGEYKNEKGELVAARPMIGIEFVQPEHKLTHPDPVQQIKDTGSMLFVTLDRLFSPKSSVGLEHMSGPVGIGKTKFQLLKSELGWHHLIYFWVIFNVNLAIFNMLPFPVLDGGHITMALWEQIRKKPLHTRFLEVVQTVCVLALMSMFLYVTMKDLFSRMGPVEQEGPKEPTFDLKMLEEAIGQAK